MKNTGHGLKIGKRRIGPSTDVYILAEVGSNHGGSLAHAKRFIDMAKRTGCDAVKFQSLFADGIATRLKNASTRIDDGFRKHGAYLHDVYKRSETPRGWLRPLREYARVKKIDFVCTPFDEESVDVLGQLDIDAFKISSFEITYERLLRKVARYRKPVILSTGMADVAEIRRAVRILTRSGVTQIAVLHCNIGYPPPSSDIHLQAIPLISRKIKRPVGFSDHTVGAEASLAAVALGARILEKHVRLGRVSAPDYSFAMGPAELEKYVASVRRVSQFLGRSWKGVSRAEKVYYRRGRRGLYAAKTLDKGRRLTPDNIAILRPCMGIPASEYDRLLGHSTRRGIRGGAPIQWADVSRS